MPFPNSWFSGILLKFNFLEDYMRKMVFTAFFFAGFVLSAWAQHNEDLFNTARLIMYGENPIGVITKVNDAYFSALGKRYSLNSFAPSISSFA
jgi:hypothetical protein